MSTSSTAGMAKTATAATRIKCQPPDLHIPILGIRPVCLSVRRSLVLPTRRRQVGAYARYSVIQPLRLGQYPPFIRLPGGASEAVREVFNCSVTTAAYYIQIL